MFLQHKKFGKLRIKNAKAQAYMLHMNHLLRGLRIRIRTSRTTRSGPHLIKFTHCLDYPIKKIYIFYS